MSEQVNSNNDAARLRKMYLDECEEKIGKLKQDIVKYQDKIKEYQRVEEKLDDIIKKLELPTLAPVCGVAFFCEAYFNRTNEIMVDLGGEMFSECSSYTAKKIIARRIAEHDKAIKGGEESIKMLEEKINYTSSLFGEDKDVVEICEPFDENAEKEFYDKRRKRKSQVTSTLNDKDKEEEEEVKFKNLMLRLGELEEEEEEKKESDGSSKVEKNSSVEAEATNQTESDEVESSDDYQEDYEKTSIEELLKCPGVTKEGINRLLEVMDLCSLSSSDEESDEVDSDDYLEVKDEKEKGITIDTAKGENGSKELKKKRRVRFSSSNSIKLITKNDTVTTPNMSEAADRQSQQPSILRNKQPTPVDNSKLKPLCKEFVPISSNTFLGDIVERQNDENGLPSIDENVNKKKVSLFRKSKLSC